jgi:diguanylate cyclase (GGDEF)-like protein/PAS domain S-box-containing protein
MIHLRDISSRKQTETVLKESEEKFRKLAEVKTIAMYIYDGSAVLFANNAFLEITGYAEAELNAGDPLEIIHPEERAQARLRFESRLRGEAITERYETRIVTRQGEERWVDLSVGMINYRGNPAVLGTFLDITDRKRAGLELVRINAELAEQLAENRLLQERLLEQAVRDVLTGLFNRRYLQETLDRELAAARRVPNEVGIIMLDLDHFKRINDTHGHRAGDLVLASLGKLILRNTRRMDIACRYGGEEFVIIMPTTSLDGARGRAEALRSAVESLEVDFEGQSLRATISAGVAAFPLHGEDGESILRAADEALYAAKAAGRNRVASAG